MHTEATAQRAVIEARDASREIIETIGAQFGPRAALGVELAVDMNARSVGMIQLIKYLVANGEFSPETLATADAVMSSAGQSAADTECTMLAYVAVAAGLDPDEKRAAEFMRLAGEAMVRLMRSILRLEGRDHAH